MARQLSETDITALESILNYHFNNPLLLQEAVRAPQLEFPLGNKRLASLGDAVLTVALLARWYDTPDSAIEAANARIDFVISDNNLDRRGTDAALGPLIIRGLAQQSRPVAQETMADTVRAILGAVYIDVDQDIGCVTPVMRALIIVAVQAVKPRVDFGMEKGVGKTLKQRGGVSVYA